MVVKRVMIVSSILVGQAISAQPSQILFRAEDSCVKTESRRGPRYHPPCQNTSIEVVKEFGRPFPEGSSLLDLSYEQLVDLNFHCESLRPVDISWRLGLHAGNIGVGGRLRSSFVTSFSGESIKIDLDGLMHVRGLQSIKPGCELEIGYNMITVEPRSAEIYVKSQKNHAKILASLFEQVTPGKSTALLLEALDQANNHLEYLSLIIDDPLTQHQIEESRGKLRIAINNFTNDCGIGTDIDFCTQEVAKVRAEIFRQIDRIHSDWAHSIFVGII